MNWDRHTDAIARLDEGDYTLAERPALEALADEYDRLVCQPAWIKFQEECDRAEFEAAWPEPGDGLTVEWGDDIRSAAYRHDDVSDGPAHWYLYGDDGPGRTWRDLVAEYGEDMGSMDRVVVLAPVTEMKRAA